MCAHICNSIQDSEQLYSYRSVNLSILNFMRRLSNYIEVSMIVIFVIALFFVACWQMEQRAEMNAKEYISSDRDIDSLMISQD